MSFVPPAFAAPALRAYSAWRWTRRAGLSERARAAIAADRKPLPAQDMGPRRAIDAAARWLERAQDCSASQDGGIARHFSLVKGWAPSYPETTGYIVPTILDVAKLTGRAELVARARKMLDWLTAIQLPGGGFQAGMIGQTPVVPTTFNTGQILIGLARGAIEFNDPKYLAAMHGAARFLRDSQDADGAWRKHPSPFSWPGDKAYEAHVAWGLFEAERVAPGAGYGEAGLRQVRWAVALQNPNGWFRDNGLEEPEIPLTHTIGYVLRGVVEAYRLSHERTFFEAAMRTAIALGRCLEADGRIAGRLDAKWRAADSYACLTGIVQIAACWFLLAEMGGPKEFAGFARRANAYVRRTMHEGGDPDTAGGVKGSHPIEGEYGRFEYLNWAAKFLIDSCLMELRHADPAGKG